MYSRITVEEVANVSNDKVELEITAQLENRANYLYTVFRICCRELQSDFCRRGIRKLQSHDWYGTRAIAQLRLQA